jgi:hypothetical protein
MQVMKGRTDSQNKKLNIWMLERERDEKPINKLMRPFKHVKVVQVDLEREFYTKHGQHMTKVGKEKVALKIAQATANILHEQTSEPISLYWKTDKVNKGNQVPREDRTIMQEELGEAALDMEVDTPGAATCEETAEVVKGGLDDSTQPGSPENLDNLGNSSTRVVVASQNHVLTLDNRISNRVRRAPVTRNKDFLW